MVENLLKKTEKIIENIAKKFTVDGFDIEDLLQEGRIKVWEVIEKRKINEENFEENKGYLIVSIENLFRKIFKKSKAKKRLNLSSSISLDKNINDEGDDFYEMLSAAEKSVTEENLANFAKIALKTKDKKAIKGTLYLLVELLKIDTEDIPKHLNYNVFMRFGLGRFLWVFFNNSPFRAINFAYHNEFMPYHMSRKPMRYWKGKKGKKRAIKNLKEVLTKTNYDTRIYPLVFDEKFCKNFGLQGALHIIFKDKTYDYLDAAYPGKYQAWEMKQTPKGFFDCFENVVKATKWVINEIFGFDLDLSALDKEEVWEMKISSKFTKDIFCEKGLRSLIFRYKSVEKVFKTIYPDKFLPWDFPKKNKWAGIEGKKLAGEATRWLIEEYCKISPFSDQITCNFFRRNGFWGMLTDKKLGFNSSPNAALKNAYPHLSHSFD